jgi:hypothetical protein
MSKDPPNRQPWKKLHSVLSWSAVGKDSLHSCISAVTDSGNALMFSRTLDGSALALTIYSGDTKSKEYITEPGDIPALLAWVMETYS